MKPYENRSGHLVTERKIHNGQIRRRVQTKIDPVSLTKQAHKDECDINQIMKKYEKTGLITHVNKIEGSYGDFSTAQDYHTSLNAVMDANNRFMGLPASLRKQFDNNPANLLAFLEDDKNYDKAVELGLIEKHKADSYLASKASKTPPELKGSGTPATPVAESGKA